VADGLPAERQGWAAAAIFTALAMASLDTAIANIALPAIAADLHVNAADVIWVVNVYQIALVATLLPLAALGEIVGHHRIYLGGLLLFTLASLACACAWSLPSLLTARALQGLGASGVMSVNTALVRFVYPGRLQGLGFGRNAMVVATAFTLGPTIASGILAKRRQRQMGCGHRDLVNVHYPDEFGWAGVKIGCYCGESDVRDCRIERGHREGGENGSGGPSPAFCRQTIDHNRPILRNCFRRHSKGPPICAI